MQSLFIKRNGITPKPLEDQNYNSEFLQNVNEVSSLIKEQILKMNSHICVVDLCAGIGGMTLELLDSPEIKLVVAFERNSKARKMLKNNIYMYNFLNKAIVYDEKYFKFEQMEDYTGACLYINLRSLEETIPKNEDSDVFEYLTSLLDKKYKNIFNSCVVYSEYMDKDIISDKFKFKNKTFDFYKIFYGTRNKNEIFSEEQLSKALKNLNLKTYVPDITQEEVKILEAEKNPITLESTSKISWSEFCKNLSKGNKSWDEKRKLIEYQKYIREVLLRIVPTETDVDKMISAENMHIWVEAIIHQSYDLNANYERLETYGDSILPFTMKSYLMNKFDSITSQGLTEFTSRYMSKEFQHKFTTDMNLNTWILSDNTRITNAVKEDLFESFIGALLKVGNGICPYLGVAYVYNFIVLLLSDTKFDMTWKYGKAISQLQQRGAMLGLNERHDRSGKSEAITGGITFEYDDKTNTGRIKMSQKLMNYLKEKFGKVYNNPLVTSEGFDKEDTENKAWDAALKVLNTAGYTAEFAQEERILHSFDNIDKELVKKVKNKAKTEGYNKLSLDILRAKKTQLKTYILKNIDDKKDIKLGIGSNEDENTAKIAALNDYLLSNRKRSDRKI
uniref:RNase III domain-containing protein n=1 Tax=viral metagenome TaxID=1070528 RepID=A0A6C0AE15_9ZZZZ